MWSLERVRWRLDLPPEVIAQLDPAGRRFQEVMLPSPALCLPPESALPNLPEVPTRAVVDLRDADIACQGPLPRPLAPLVAGQRRETAFGQESGQESGILEPPEPPPLPETPEGLEGYLADFQTYLVSYAAYWVTNWLAGTFPGLAAGPWSAVLVLIANIIKACANPRERARELLDQLETRDRGYIQNLRPVEHVETPPSWVTVTPASIKVRATGSEVPFDMAAFAVPFDQEVKISWSIWGHAAVCMESVAVAEIVGNQDGRVWKPFRREVYGAYIFPTRTETRTSKGKVSVFLPAGAYALRVAGSNGYSGGSMTIGYQKVGGYDLGRIALYGGAAVGAGLGAYAAYRFLTRPREARAS